MLDIVTQVDAWLQGMLPPLACIILWGAASAIFSMFLYKWLSPQKKLLLLKAEHKSVRAALIRHDGDFAELQKIIFKDLGLSLKQIGLIFPAFAITVLPVIALIFCLFVRYGYALPEAGDKVIIAFHPENTTQEIIWSDATSPVEIKDTDGNKLLTLPLPTAIPEVTKPSWLTALFPNPIGVLPEETAVDTVHIGLPPRYYTYFGADWMRGFEFWYILSLLIVSLIIKVRFKII